MNQSRNLVIRGLTYGPQDPEWQEKFVRWAATFPHIARCSLRGEPPCPEVVELVGAKGAEEIQTAHMPSFVAMKLAAFLREACDRDEMDRQACHWNRSRAGLPDRPYRRVRTNLKDSLADRLFDQDSSLHLSVPARAAPRSHTSGELRLDRTDHYYDVSVKATPSFGGLESPQGAVLTATFQGL